MQHFNVLIYGGGAVGSVLGWRLSQHARAKVSIVCRSNFDAVSRSGFTMETVAWGNGHFVPDHIMRAGSLLHRQRTAQNYTYVICANKVTHESYAAVVRDLSQLVGPSTTIVSAQNGMDVELPLRQAFPHNTILSAICNIGCSQTSPGIVKQAAGMNPKAFQIGVYGNTTNGRYIDMRRRDELVSLDARFGAVDDINQQRWKKLIFNTVWNATCALYDLDTHQVLDRLDASQLAHGLAREACMIARLSGADLDEQHANEVITLAQDSAAITPSTLQDLRARRALEIDSIWGYLRHKAIGYGVESPLLSLVHDTLQQINEAFKNANITEAAPRWTPRSPAYDMPVHRPVSAIREWMEERTTLNRELRQARMGSPVAA